MTDTVGDYSYTWDANKNKISEAITGVMSPYGFNSAAGQQPAAYDADDRLVGWNRNDGNLDQAWTLTPVGDWDLFTEEAVTQDRSHGPAHEITDVTIGANTNSVQHDVKGNVTFIPSSLRSPASSLSLSWDFDNRLASADTDNGGTADVTFGYDALGRRVRKTTATLDTVFVQAGQQIIADYTAGAVPTSPREKYVYASYIDEPILKDGTLASGTGIVYYHRNQQYSVTALTDASGSVIERYAYDPHGALTILDASGTPLATQQSPTSNRITYTGRELDIETHLYHFRARVYSPTLGRFLSRDPLGFVDGMSLYRGYFIPGGVDPEGTKIINCECRRGNRFTVAGLFGANKFVKKIDCKGLATNCCKKACSCNTVNVWSPSCHPTGKWWPDKQPPPYWGTFTGVEGHFIGGVGLTSVTCCNEKNRRIRMYFFKWCIGGAAGIGAGKGIVNMQGKNCRPESYTGWFVEVGGTIGIVGGGVDVGVSDRGPGGIPGGLSPSTAPGGLSGTNEASGGLGLGAKVKFSLCRYYLIGEPKDLGCCN